MRADYQQKRERDQQARTKHLNKIRKRLERLRPRGRGGVFRSVEAAREAVERVLAKSQARKWLRVQIDEKTMERLEIIAEALSITSAEALRRVIEVGLPVQEEKHAARLKPGKA